MNLCSQLNVTADTTLPSLKDANKYFSQFLSRPWDILKKFNHRGSVHPFAFKSPLVRLPEFETIIHNACNESNYPLKYIGAYLLPLERGRAVHLEFDLHCDPSNPEEVEKVKKLWLKCSDVLISKGALFDRPYGAWAEMVYRRTGTYTKKLKELKDKLDPHHIMNPGKLCF
jgi:hypothetical protein